MTYTTHPETTGHLSDTAWHVLTTIIAAVGIVAAALGAWLEFGPENGTLTLFDWTWNVSELSTLWAPMLMIGGGIAMAVSMGYEAIRDWEKEAKGWLVFFELFAALIGMAAIVVGLIVLF